MTDKKILIVDDEASIRKMFRLILERAGYTVLEADRALTGLGILKQQKIDLMLLDIMMPGMSGIECLENTKKDFLEMPVIIITGLINVKTRLDVIMKGAAGYIMKPVRRKDLLDAVEKAFITVQ